MSNCWYFIVNPISGSGKGLQVWNRLKPFLEKNQIPYDFGISRFHNHTVQLVSHQHHKGIRNFVGLGGDGTLNEMVNAILQNTKDSEDISTIAQIGVGTGNDWVRNRTDKANEFNIVDKILRNRILQHDIGIVKGSHPDQKRFFINVAGAGLDGCVVEGLEKMNKSGKKNKLAYVQSMLKSLTRYDAPESRVWLGNQKVYSGKMLLVTASKGQFFGGGMHISPKARQNTGTFDISVIKKESNLVIFAQLYKLFNGKIENASFVEKYQYNHLKLRTLTPVPIQADGEFIGYSTTVEFSISPHTIQVLE